MAKVSIDLQLAVLLVLSCAWTSVTYGRNQSVRAVNLGGWLVTEGYIRPSLFDGIPNKDFLDGTELTLKSVTHGKYLSAKSGGGTTLILNGTSATEFQKFRLWRIRETTFYLRVANGQFMGINSDGSIAAAENTTGLSHEFEIERHPDYPIRVRIKASNGFYIQVKTEELITADFMGCGGWGDDDPSVFKLKITYALKGEFQVTNGYGAVKAPQVMRDHWNTFIVEEDFKFLSRNGINAVRIPVGWWIADPSPPEPFVSGSLETLDKAFLWARKYGLKVIVLLHAAPGSQNPWEHSGTRDGSMDWGKNDETIQQSVAVIEFLTARYAMDPSLYAVELINEPTILTSLDTMKKYYKAGYDVVRRHSQTVYVVLSNRMGISDPTELISFASGLERSVVDLHYYNLFREEYDDMSVDQNIRFIKRKRLPELRRLATSGGPLIFVGEWVNEWNVKNASRADLIRFSKAQLEVYGEATFGWAYWTYRAAEQHWDLKWMIENGYIKLPGHCHRN